MTYAYTLCGHEYVANEDFDKVFIFDRSLVSFHFSARWWWIQDTHQLVPLLLCICDSHPFSGSTGQAVTRFRMSPLVCRAFYSPHALVGVPSLFKYYVSSFCRPPLPSLAGRRLCFRISHTTFCLLFLSCIFWCSPPLSLFDICSFCVLSFLRRPLLASEWRSGLTGGTTTPGTASDRSTTARRSTTWRSTTSAGRFASTHSPGACTTMPVGNACVHASTTRVCYADCCRCFSIGLCVVCCLSR